MNYDAILIDDDELVHMTWAMAAQRYGKKIKTYYSEALFLQDQRTLSRSIPILVEPEAENVKLLKKRLQLNTPEIQPSILQTKFEVGSFTLQDLILFPYDSLPMLTDTTSRSKIFTIASRHLNPNGIFAIHVSTPSWVSKELSESCIVKQTFFRTLQGTEITVKRSIRQVSDTEYIKFISIEDQSNGIRENYLAMTSIVTSNEILEAAKQAGFVLQNRYRDFFCTPFSPLEPESDDDIFIFRKH